KFTTKMTLCACSWGTCRHELWAKGAGPHQQYDADGDRSDYPSGGQLPYWVVCGLPHRDSATGRGQPLVFRFLWEHWPGARSDSIRGDVLLDGPNVGHCVLGVLLMPVGLRVENSGGLLQIDSNYA